MAGGGAKDSDNSSSATTSSTDPLDTDGNGTVSAQQRSAGEVKQATKTLLSSLATDSSQQTGSDSTRFDTLMKQLSSGTSSTGVSTAVQSSAASQSVDFTALANEVMRHYAQAQAGAAASALGSTLSVAG